MPLPFEPLSKLCRDLILGCAAIGAAHVTAALVVQPTASDSAHYCGVSRIGVICMVQSGSLRTTVLDTAFSPARHCPHSVPWHWTDLTWLRSAVRFSASLPTDRGFDTWVGFRSRRQLLSLSGSPPRAALHQHRAAPRQAALRQAAQKRDPPSSLR